MRDGEWPLLPTLLQILERTLIARMWDHMNIRHCGRAIGRKRSITNGVDDPRIIVERSNPREQGDLHQPVTSAGCCDRRLMAREKTPEKDENQAWPPEP